MRRNIHTLGIALFSFSPLLSSQGLSTINGTVTDPSGAVVAGANITVKEVDTSLARATVSNQDGLYVISGLRPTRYTLNVEGHGFRQFAQSGIVLEANDTLVRVPSVRARQAEVHCICSAAVVYLSHEISTVHL